MKVFSSFAITGSPPRMRGKVHCVRGVTHHDGITPACAGKSSKIFHDLFIVGDHPRVCGEKSRPLSRWVYALGSPPRMRGKAVAIFRQLHHGRITPACAGKSEKTRSITTTRRDHPRVCGEKDTSTVCQVDHEGSPPRVRGKVHISTGQVGGVGITPAYAGKRSGKLQQDAMLRDHPRVCGEKRTTAGRSSGACAATSNAIGMVTSALYRSAMSYTKEHSCPTCTNPSPGAHPSATMTAWASPYRQACTVGHTGAGAEQQHRNARHIIHGCFLRAGWSSGQGRRLCRGQCPDTASPGTLPGRSPAGCPHRSPPAT